MFFVHCQRYLDEAEREKMQYAQELKEYQQTEAYQITTAKIHDKRIKKGDQKVKMYMCYSMTLRIGNMHVCFSLSEDTPSVIITSGSESSLSKVDGTSMSPDFTFCSDTFTDV